MVRLILATAVTLFATTLVALTSAPAFAADQPQYAPPAAWVHAVAISDAAPPAGSAPVQMLLFDRQTKLGPDGEDYFSETATKILSPEGLSAVGTISMVWDPDTETLIIHAVRIIRGGRVIDVLASGQKFVVLRRENNLELAMLDGRLTATMEPEGLQVGDIVDIASTVQRRDPALKGHSTGLDALEYPGIGAHVMLRAVWSSPTAARWRVTEGLSQPQVSHDASGSELVIDMTNVEAPKPPKGAPARFQELGVLELTDFASWSALSQLASPLYQTATTLAPDSALKAEIAKIAALSPDPKVRAMAALRLVEDQVRYVFLGMNDGGFVPAAADVTWSRRFGDCKGKTALLVALLRGLGIEAEPSLVSTAFGDGLDQRLPGPTWFDHVMVRATIGGKVYWLDGTRVGDRRLDDLQVPGFGWTLPVRAAGAELVKLEPQQLTTPGVATVITIDASKGMDAPASTHIEQVFHGDYAVALRASLAAAPRADFERALRELWSKNYPWLEVSQLTIAEDGADGGARISGDGMGKLEWRDEPDGGRVFRVPGSAMTAAVVFHREPGPDIDAPYLVAFPYYETTQRRITLPTGGAYTLVGADIDETVAGQALLRRTRVENGVLTINSSTRTLAAEFPAAQAEAASATLRDLSQRDVALEFRPRPSALSQGAAPVAATVVAPIPTLDADQAAAARGDAQAETRLAARYEKGDGLPYDLVAARDWLTKAAAQGSVRGETMLAALLIERHNAADRAAAAALLQKAADTGDARAEAMLAVFYQIGDAEPKDPARALALLQKSAAQGDEMGEGLLGNTYFHGLGVAPNYDLAFVYLTQAAAQGNSGAEVELGMAFQGGLGTGKDPDRAIQLLKQAAAQGSMDAPTLLGALYQGGGGIAPDYAQALVWYGVGAARGDSRAEIALAAMAEQGQGEPADPAKAMDWLQKAAAQGSAEAMTAIGEFYDQGGGGVSQDHAQAAAWFQKAADLGSTRAAAELARLYAMGFGVAEDDAKALQLATQSADHGDAGGEYMLGWIYWQGKGVAADAGHAFTLMQSAAQGGSTQAQATLGLFYLDGRGVTPSDSQALHWFNKAVATGSAPLAEMGLGYMYERGRGVAADRDAAARWYRAALSHGVHSAAAGLARVTGPASPRGPPVVAATR